MKCLLLVGQTQGRKCKVVLDSDNEPLVGPSLKRTRVALPRKGESADVVEKWRQCIVDVLEILKAKCDNEICN